MYEKLEECPSCSSPKFNNHLIVKDHSISQESFSLVKCTTCNLIFTNPRPDKDNIGKYYESDNYISHSNSSKSIIDLAYKSVRKITLKSKINLISSLVKDKTILDYGCGTGHFLKICKDNLWNIQGIEPNATARMQAEDYLQQNVLSDVSELNGESFSIITLWHVLEHVHDLNDTFSTLKKKLAKSGYMIVALPNPDSYDAKKYEEHWAAYDVPRHLYHFNKKSFTTFAEKHKMIIRNIKPMPFDAYYVSLLSEKYKGSNLAHLKFLLTGLKSNRKAKSQTDHSSLIYVLQNK